MIRAEFLYRKKEDKLQKKSEYFFRRNLVIKMFKMLEVFAKSCKNFKLGFLKLDSLLLNLKSKKIVI